jgi:hypothetical protein
MNKHCCVAITRRFENTGEHGNDGLKKLRSMNEDPTRPYREDSKVDGRSQCIGTEEARNHNEVVVASSDDGLSGIGTRRGDKSTVSKKDENARKRHTVGEARLTLI